MYDLVLAGGRVIDPAQGIDGIRDVAFADGKVAAVTETIDAAGAKELRDVSGLVVTPGLIDLHTHIYWGATAIGVKPAPLGARSAATTLIDAGSAGPGNLEGFRAFIIEPSEVRILAYLNISFAGIFAFSKAVMVGESSDLRLLNVDACVEAADANRDLIVGVKVRIGSRTSGQSGIEPLKLAREAAEQLGLPVMAHFDYPPPSRAEVLDLLRPGDVLTHCFRPFPDVPMTANDVRAEMQAARERGVIFDVGHGMGSFGFDVARAMLDGGFAPDVISSDVHSLSADGPAFDLLVTMSKMLCLGMALPDVIDAATARPAAALGRKELGTLAPGSPGDAAILAVEDGEFDYVDAKGDRMTGEYRLAARDIVLGGRWWSGAEAGG
jgi:dihydroorotase